MHEDDDLDLWASDENLEQLIPHACDERTELVSPSSGSTRAKLAVLKMQRRDSKSSRGFGTNTCEGDFGAIVDRNLERRQRNLVGSEVRGVPTKCSGQAGGGTPALRATGMHKHQEHMKAAGRRPSGTAAFALPVPRQAGKAGNAGRTGNEEPCRPKTSSSVTTSSTTESAGCTAGMGLANRQRVKNSGKAVGPPFSHKKEAAVETVVGLQERSNSTNPQRAAENSIRCLADQDTSVGTSMVAEIRGLFQRVVQDDTSVRNDPIQNDKSATGDDAEEVRLTTQARQLEEEMICLQEKRLRLAMQAEEVRIRKAARISRAEFEAGLQNELDEIINSLQEERQEKLQAVAVFRRCGQQGTPDSVLCVVCMKHGQPITKFLLKYVIH